MASSKLIILTIVVIVVCAAFISSTEGSPLKLKKMAKKLFKHLGKRQVGMYPGMYGMGMGGFGGANAMSGSNAYNGPFGSGASSMSGASAGGMGK